LKQIVLARRAKEHISGPGLKSAIQLYLQF